MNADRPLRIAVVGSGPAGFYAAGQLLAADTPIEVDLIERLPTPWGLVRLGVAPDHPNIKAVSRVFEKTAQRPGFRFLGNVEVGRDLEHAELAELYDAVVYSVGAQTDRRLGIPGEDLPAPGRQPPSSPGTTAIRTSRSSPSTSPAAGRWSSVTGTSPSTSRGCWRSQSPRSRRPTRPMRRSRRSSDRGSRRSSCSAAAGPRRPSFTTPELVELGELADTDVVVDPAELELEPASEPALAESAVARNLAVLQEYAARRPSGKRRVLRLRFRVSPVAILGEDRVEGIEVVRNELVAEGGRVRAVPTGETEVIPCGAVFRSVGYRGVAVPGVPFDEELGTMSNRGGRVLDAGGEQVPGLYCAGWIKRGPTGIIGTNKKDAAETVAAILEDAASGALPRRQDVSAGRVDAALAERGVDVVSHSGWEAIDAIERARGDEQGRPRVKLLGWDELLAIGPNGHGGGRLRVRSEARG